MSNPKYSKISPSWLRQRDGEIHSPEGVEDMKREVKDGLTRFYVGIAESMWRYDFPDEAFQDMLTMSQDTVPEQWLVQNGKCCWFAIEGQLHCLPLVYDSEGLNLYGKIAGWSPMPYGYNDLTKSGKTVPRSWSEIASMKLDPSNSVIMKNDLHGRGDGAMIEKMVDALVDNVLTMSQLQLLASSPYIFNVTEDNLLSAKNYFLMLSEHKPAIFLNSMGDKPVPQLEQVTTRIDPALFDLFDRFECILLTYLGFPCVPISKRAQQSVSEVQSNDDKLTARRMEKLLQRERAIDRLNRLFGTHASVVSIIDEMQEQAREQAREQERDQKEGEANDGA